MKRLLTMVLLALMISACTEANREKLPDSNQPQEEPLQSAQEEPQETADEMLSSFSVSGYTKGGEKQWDLEGKSADIMTEVIKLSDVTGRIYGKEVDMTIVADQGSLNRIDNNVHLEKNVKATTEDGATLVTDYLDWDAQNQKLASEAPVWIKRGAMEAFGTGIVGQPTLNLVELKKDVTVKISMEEQGAGASPEAAGFINDTAAIEKQEQPLSPTVITCEGPLEVEYEINLAVFRDNVVVKDSRGEIFADKMDVYFSAETERNKQIKGMEGMSIEKIVATGNVEIHHQGNITYSQKALYDTDTGKLTLTGQPKLVIYSTEGFSQLK